MIYFTRTELECPCCHQYRVAAGFEAMIDDIRSRWGVMVINSCCRCRKHNSSVGGKPKSYHLLDLPSRQHGCCAADVVVRAEKQQAFVDIIKATRPLVSTIQYRIKGIVHMDDRTSVYGANVYDDIIG